MTTLFFNTLRSKGQNPTSFCIFSSPCPFCGLCLILNVKVNISSIILFYKHTIFNFFSLYCASQILNFLKIEVCGNPALRKSMGTIFPTFSHFVSLYHILVILTIFQIFLLLLYVLWWSVINELWYYYCNYFGEPWTTPIYDGELTQCCLSSDWPTNWPFSISLPLLGHSYSLSHTNTEIRPILQPYSGLLIFKWKEELQISHFK